MTDLRDARLRQALEQAPDAQLRPPPPVREAVRAAARGAVRGPVAPWWRRWVGAGSDRRVPWSAALATVVVATLITVTWRGQDVPGARPEAPGADQAMREEAPAAAGTLAGGETPAPASAPVVGTRAHPTESPPASAPAPAPAAADADADADADRARSRVQERSEREESRSARRAERTARPAPAAPVPAQQPPVELRDTPPAASPPGPPPRAARMAPPPAPMADMAPSPPAAARMAPPPPVAQSDSTLPSMAPAPAAPSAAPPPPAAALRAVPQRMAEWQRWTQVRIDDGSSAVLLPRGQAAGLPELLEGVLRAPADAAPSGTASVRLQLLDGGQELGTLEAVQGEWRWTPAPGAQPPAAVRGLRVDPALAAALLAEAERLLRR